MCAQVKEDVLSCSPDQVSRLNRIFGQHECQLSKGGGEADLHTHFEKCEKNPSHKYFIPVKHFTIEHLPERYRDTDLFEWIKAQVDITVRICVDVFSPNRPKFYPGTDSPYPFNDINDRDNNTRTGTGSFFVLKYIDGLGYTINDGCQNKVGRKYKQQNKTCTCEKCKNSDKPSRIWWAIIVNTAAHVVFDDFEARHTSIRLFFDENNCEKIILSNFSVYESDIENDWCKLYYATCDADIWNRFYEKFKHQDILDEKVRQKFTKVLDVNFVCIVSHPHGCPKMISFGECKEIISGVDHDGEFSKDFKMAKLTYDAPTCPGSSGARVFYLASDNSNVHNGHSDSGTNCSSYGPIKYVHQTMS